MENTYSAENAVIGSMLLDPQCIGEIIHEITPDDFQDDINKNIFSAIRAQFLSGQAVDPVLISEKLSGKEQNFMAECMRITPTAANFAEYTAIVKDAGQLRRMQAMGIRLMEAHDLDEADDVLRKLNALSATVPEGVFQTAQQAANEFADTLNERITHGARFIGWGIYPLDMSLHTVPGNFIVIGASPSTGKTALAMQTALYMATAGHRVLFVSLEMGSIAICDRIVAHLSGVSIERIARGKLSGDDVKRTNSACERLYSLPIVFDYSARTVQQIQARALSERAEIVIVDYLQHMDSGKFKSRYEAVTAFSLDLQRFAHQSRVLVIALSQLSRQQKTADGKERKPGLTDLRESGQLEQDADAVILMSLKDSNDRQSDRYVQLAKNRQGRCADFYLRFHGDTQRFEYQRCMT